MHAARAQRGEVSAAARGQAFRILGRSLERLQVDVFVIGWIRQPKQPVYFSNGVKAPSHRRRRLFLSLLREKTADGFQI